MLLDSIRSNLHWIQALVHQRKQSRTKTSIAYLEKVYLICIAAALGFVAPDAIDRHDVARPFAYSERHSWVLGCNALFRPSQPYLNHQKSEFFEVQGLEV